MPLIIILQGNVHVNVANKIIPFFILLYYSEFCFVIDLFVPTIPTKYILG